MSQPSERMKQLIDALYQKSRDGSLSWRPTDWQVSYAHAMSSGSIVIRRNGALGPGAFTAEGTSSLSDQYSIEVLDRTGNTVERFSAFGEASPSGYEPLVRLFETVHATSSKGDPRLDAVLAELQSA